MTVPIGTIHRYARGQRMKVADVPRAGDANWAHVKTRLPTAALAERGWSVGTVLTSASWSQPRTVRYIVRGMVWFRSYRPNGLPRTHKPVRSIPGDVAEVSS